MDPKEILSIVSAFFDALRSILIAFGFNIKPKEKDNAAAPTGE